ncbi:hypothetical protein [Pseudomonas nitroreducens]|uniref:hypothetical protein n=1 Tax=Pseudomonas nitroreducens TaxID=46680 RepID=UPI001A8D7C87|nr:hypothetical protein [Pseudomonas nitroreducens]
MLSADSLKFEFASLYGTFAGVQSGDQGRFSVVVLGGGGLDLIIAHGFVESGTRRAVAGEGEIPGKLKERLSLADLLPGQDMDVGYQTGESFDLYF